MADGKQTGAQEQEETGEGDGPIRGYQRSHGGLKNEARQIE